VLVESLERRLLADVPVGAFLSSGIDSSLVCALAARRLRRQLVTFCAGFEGGGEDETAASRRIAERLELPHRGYVVSSTDLLAVAQRFGALVDEPNGDRSCVPVYLLAREIRREVTVAISGDGGDELFCGYERYAGFDAVLRESSGRGAQAAVELYFERALPVFPPSVLKPLFPEQYAAWRQDFLALYAPVMLRSGWNAAQRLSVLDFHTYLPGAVLSKVDRMCMRHALEVRTPFLEPRIMDLAASLPPALCANAVFKPVLRRLLERHLPTGLSAPRKIGFGMPERFMRAHAQIFRQLFDAACQSLRATAFFADRRNALDALIKHAPGNVNSLWALTVLGLWVDSVGRC
jgi:asparagine synthase (glutamine-hydrolysing)